MPYIQKVCPPNTASPGLYRTYAGTSNDRFTARQDAEPYCVEISLAGATAMTAGNYPNDDRNLTHWYTEEKLIAPYNATLGDFQTVIEDTKRWRVNLINDTIPDYNAVSAREIFQIKVLAKSVYPTATTDGCYSRMDSSYGESGYYLQATKPINSRNWYSNSPASYSPSLTIARLYSRSRFYRVRIYKNDVLIDTIVTIGCWNESNGVYRGHNIAPTFVFSGFVTNQCPPDTCAVDCGTHFCCYNSQGISVFNYLK